MTTTTTTDRTYLVVDDALTSLRQASLLLQQQGVEEDRILQACSADEAYQLFEAHGPDTVLLDIDLPDMGGHEFAKDLKEIDPETDLVALTALDEADSRVQELRRSGVTSDVLHKPVEAEHMAEVAGTGLE